MPDPVAAVSTSTTAFVGLSPAGPLYTATEILSLRDYEDIFGPLHPASEMGFAAGSFFANGGTTLYVVRAGACDECLGADAAQNALQALDSVPVLNLLCLPGVTDPAVLSAAQAWCEARRAFLILDVDANAATAEQLAAAIATLSRSTSAAVYAPWLEIPDPLGGSEPRRVAPSGAVAGVYARIDNMRGVWRAPAGTNAIIAGVDTLAATIPENESPALQELGLNLLRALPEKGVAIWGARTLADSTAETSDFLYVPVRRMALFLEQSIAAGTQWAVFEPNGPALWEEIRSSVSAFLYRLFLQGPFQGSTARDAYFVKCGTDSMTQDDIDQGVLKVVVGFAPVRPAEFVILTIQSFAGKPQAAGGAGETDCPA